MNKCSVCKKISVTLYSNSLEKDRCRDCYGYADANQSPYVKTLANNPHKPWLTKAGNDVISNRVVSRDDGRTVIDRRNGKPTPFVTRD